MAGEENSASVHILTLNCWGLKFVSQKRRERIEAIAKRLSQCDDFDIIALQEVWVESDYQLLRSSVQQNLPFAKRWYSGIFAGPGLAIFSRWPIESAWLYRFPLNGRPSAFWRGDWYVGKAAGSCVIVHPSGRKLEIINAHLHAPYAPSGDAAYSCHRAAQAWDMSGIVWRGILSGHATFVTGDLNTRPQSIGLRLFEQRGHLSDAWVASHDQKELDAAEIAALSPAEQILRAGVTSDSQLNTWRRHYAINRAKRLDYIFFDDTTATAVNSRVCFTEPEPGVGSLSDHFGFAATFNLNVDQPGAQSRPVSRSEVNTLRGLHEELLEIIHTYWKTSRAQSWWRLCHFWVSMLFVVGTLISIWWGALHNRAYVGFIFIITAVVVAVTGVVDGLIGFVFGGNEQRALTEFEEQVRLSQMHLTISY